MKKNKQRPTVVAVKRNHIENGKTHHSTQCPVALALASVFGEPVEVYTAKIQIRHGTYRIPAKVMNKIALFDRTGKMKPFSFEVHHG